MSNKAKNATPSAPAMSIPDVNGIATPTTFEFKSAALTASAEVIAKAAINIKTGARIIASELGRVAASKSYAEDGFKSVADFAEKTFSINRSQAYAWAEVGQRFLNGEGETAKAVAALPISNAAVMLPLTDAEVEEGVKSGDIRPDSTQAELKEYAAKVKANRPIDGNEAPKVLPMFEVYVHFGPATKALTTSMIEADIPGAVASAVGCGTIKEDIKLAPTKYSEEKNAPKVNRRLYIFDNNGEPAPVLVEYVKVEAPTKTSKKDEGKSVHDMTAAELAELLKKAQEREAKAAKEEVEG